MPNAKFERLTRFDKLTGVVRRRKALHQQRRIECSAIELAETSHQPYEVLAGQLPFQKATSPSQILRQAAE